MGELTVGLHTSPRYLIEPNSIGPPLIPGSRESGNITYLCLVFIIWDNENSWKFGKVGLFEVYVEGISTLLSAVSSVRFGSGSGKKIGTRPGPRPPPGPDLLGSGSAWGLSGFGSGTGVLSNIN